jgi:hypothetical protein
LFVSCSAPLPPASGDVPSQSGTGVTEVFVPAVRQTPSLPVGICQPEFVVVALVNVSVNKFVPLAPAVAAGITAASPPAKIDDATSSPKYVRRILHS